MTPDRVTNHVTGQVTCHRPFLRFVYVCLCLFTYVWSLDLLGKLYIVPMLRELTSLSFNINHDTPINISSDLVTGGPAHKLSPSLPLGTISGLWGNRLLQYVEANTWSPDFHVFFHSGTTPLILLKTSVSHPSYFFWCSGTTLFQL